MYYFAQVCRACIKNDGKLIKIHTLDDDNITFHEKLTLCFPKMNFEETCLKIYLCQSCANILRTLYNFRELCINSDKILNAYVLQLEQASSFKNRKLHLNQLMDDNYKDLTMVKIETKSELKLENFNLEVHKEVIKTEALDFEDAGDEWLKSNSLLDIKNEIVDIEPDCQDYVVSAECTDKQDTNTNKDSTILPTNISETSRPKRQITPKLIKNIEKRYKCDVCSKSFKESHHLLAHNRIHTGEKPYECDECHKSFNQLGNLRMHKRIHTGVKPYKCDTCVKCFNNSRDLKKHKIIHTGLRPYVCETCRKCFYNISHLKRHMRTHTGEKPYECDVCSKRFKHLNSQQAHKRLHINSKQ